MKTKAFSDILSLSWSAIKASPLRTVLTSLIISFGIMALVGILSATDALKQSLESNFTSLGANTLTVRNSQGGFFAGGAKRRQNPNISYRQAKAFKDRMTFAGARTSLTYVAGGTEQLSYGNTSTNPNNMVTAADENYLYTGGFELEEGRNFTADDVQRGKNYVILGNETKTTLFGDASAAGKTIKMRGKPYTVVGVLAEKGNSGMFSGDRGAWVTITYARANFTAGQPNYTLSINAPSAPLLDAVQGQCTALMRSVRKLKPKEENNFYIIRSDSIARSLIENLGMVTTGAFIIGIITLLGASIALMNIMLVSVTERTREIGTRKALGATKKSISSQFLGEAIVITQLGGWTGIVFGIIIGNVVANMVDGQFFIPWIWITVAFILSVGVGLLAGWYPASKAAALNPVDALRHE
ncbi:MAG: ABC transporter permease [Cryomorphaceae bacterium]|nr:ABC transporter permease [Cryomorphaceae bacterium]